VAGSATTFWARAPRALGIVIALLALVPVVAWLRVMVDGGAPSVVHGNVAHGSIEHAHVIPPRGDGYVTYSWLGAALGRQYVDGRVRDVLLATFAARAATEPGRQFVVGETGWPKGGSFRPHRSHQNGMAVDVFMPIVSATGRPDTLGTWPWNKFGYGLEFDERGHLGNLRIDFDCLAAFISELDVQAQKQGLVVGRVIVAPEFVSLILDTPAGRRLGALGDRITRKPVWVRHDEHFHVDFEAR
jgi:penicillin-insensitive murein endopeptidase